MPVVDMESQCMKTVMIHIVEKSDFILSDHKTRCKSLIARITSSVQASFILLLS